jgi:hypothetical protein
VFAGNVQVGGDVIVENANEGNDVVFASVSYTLPDNIEQLSLINGTGTGNGLNNTFFSDHPFTSKIFRGGGGDDTYFVIDQRDGIEEDPDGGIETVWVGSLAFSYTLTDPDVENLAITGQRVVGTGNINANALSSRHGQNTLVGGGGNDVYFVYHNDDVVRESAGEGTDAVWSFATSTLGVTEEVEQLVIQGAGFTGTGNDLDNALFSYGGPNTLEGGRGNDVYFLHNTNDLVRENADEGLDIVYADVNYTLSDPDVEDLVLTAPGTTGTGNASANVLMSLASNVALFAGQDAVKDMVYFLTDWGASSAGQLELATDYLTIQSSLFGGSWEAVLSASSRRAGNPSSALSHIADGRWHGDFPAVSLYEAVGLRCRRAEYTFALSLC